MDSLFVEKDLVSDEVYQRVSEACSLFVIPLHVSAVLSAVDCCHSSDNLRDCLLCGLLFLGGSGALAAPRPVRGHLTSLNRHILDQTTVVEVDQCRDRNVLLLDVLVVQDRLDRLLHLG